MRRISRERLRSLLSYDPETGHFTWLSTGRVAGWQVGGNGRDRLPAKRIHVDGKFYEEGRLVWFYMTGRWPIEVDHKDRDRLNNRWSNLRPATRAQNQANTSLYRNNRARIRGVHLREGRWRAMISEGGRNRHIGYFDTAEEAAAAWEMEALRIHGAFASVRCAGGAHA